MVVMMTGVSLYKSYVFILHCDFYEHIGVNLKQLCLFVYLFE